MKSKKISFNTSTTGNLSTAISQSTYVTAGTTNINNNSILYDPNTFTSITTGTGYMSASPSYSPYQSMEFGDHKFKIKLTLNNPDDWVKMAEMFSKLMSDADIKHTATYIEEGVEVHKSDR